MSNNGHAILLVEDDHNDVLLIKRAFQKVNIANPIIVVNDGEQAISYLAGREPYVERALPMLVLLDLKLPRKSGHEVLEWLRQQSTLRRLPVVVLTASSESSDVNLAYDLGANSYLVKPVTFDSLVQMVKTLNLYWLILNKRADVSDE
ncbi:chemotaxis protein CheY [candidate division WOR_3 bacterium SM23_42]|uniref:Chemotaxis protein CheY n=1 Tax=candidate division WOR_3 bacterium SM23_42 TaxID=1703779 RepID=A0A0S8FQQ0_UNCW3|nr:MAG: chemotaxis protein CheY [candidate division WOR_3 bacterium SM23_42]